MEKVCGSVTQEAYALYQNLFQTFNNFHVVQNHNFIEAKKGDYECSRLRLPVIILLPPTTIRLSSFLPDCKKRTKSSFNFWKLS